MTAPMRTMPAMPPVPGSIVVSARIHSAFGMEVPAATTARAAYCYAQAAADRDGLRRRVFKDGDVWRIEVARVHDHGPNRGAGLDCPERVVRGHLRGACMDGAQ